MFGLVGGYDGRLTFRELYEMARGPQESQWAQTSLLAALICNAHRGKETPLRRPSFFNPFSPDFARDVGGAADGRVSIRLTAENVVRVLGLALRVGE